MCKGSAMLAAFRYAAKGIPVVPIESDGKAPVVKGGVHAASVDRKQIEDWWRRWPRSSLALPCGPEAGFDALDVDKQHDGIETLKAFLRTHGPLPITAWQRTASGGFHLLFRHRPGLKNWSGGQGLAPRGLDCRTTGAKIRTAPVKGYRWMAFFEPAALPPWPECLAAFFQKIEGSVRVVQTPPASFSWTPSVATRSMGPPYADRLPPQEWYLANND